MKLALAALVLTMAAGTAGAQPKPSSCIVAPDKRVAVKPEPGRVLYCGLDLGSRSVKLSVVSMEKGRATTVRDERICKRSLGMGALVFDSKTGTARPLPAEAIASLAETITEYKAICARDGGTVAAAGATQWARDATNIASVREQVDAATGIRFDVLSPKQEAEHSYTAGSVSTPAASSSTAAATASSCRGRRRGLGPSPASWYPMDTCAAPPTSSTRRRTMPADGRPTSSAQKR